MTKSCRVTTLFGRAVGHKGTNCRRPSRTQIAFERHSTFDGCKLQQPRPAQPPQAPSEHQGRDDLGPKERRTATLGNGQLVPLATIAERASARAILLGATIALFFVALVASSLWLLVVGYWVINGPSPLENTRDAMIAACALPALAVVVPALFEGWRNSSASHGRYRGLGSIELIRFDDGAHPNFLESSARAMLPIGAAAVGYCVAVYLGPWSVSTSFAALSLCVALLLIVHLSALLRTDRRGWADLATGTVVVPARSKATNATGPDWGPWPRERGTHPSS